MLKYETFLRFPQGKEKAFTLSYDDGVFADVRLMEILQQYGVSCTFNLNSGLFHRQDWHNRLPEADVLKLFGEPPHEIALHGHRHLFLSKCAPVQIVEEIVCNRKYLESNFHRVVNGMAYAYGDVNSEIENVCKQCGVVYGRTTHATHEFSIPQDFLQWNPTCHHGDERLNELAQKFVSTAPSDFVKAREPYLFYVWGHSYEYDDHNNWQVLIDLLQKVARRNDVWYATNGEIYAYVSAYKNLVWSADGNLVQNPSALDLWVERDKKIVHIPASATVEVQCKEQE